MNPAPQQERSLGELFKELAGETGTLVRQEVQLAKTEVTEKAKAASKDAVMIGAGALLGHVALLVVVAGLILALGTLIPYWASAFIVGALLAVTAFVLTKRGVTALKKIDPVPRVTVQTLKEDQRWATQQVHRPSVA